MSFITESIKEFDHVVWPTKAETKKYFLIVTGVITVFAIFLFLVGNSLSWSLFALKDQVHPATLPVSNEAAKNLDLEDLQLDKTSVATGAVQPSASGSVRTGSGK